MAAAMPQKKEVVVDSKKKMTTIPSMQFRGEAVEAKQGASHLCRMIDSKSTFGETDIRSSWKLKTELSHLISSWLMSVGSKFHC